MTRTRILVSACLLGQPVRYNGRALTLESDILSRWVDDGLVVSLCPEVAAGFPTPRPPAEIQSGMIGADVIAGKGRIIEDTGRDVTDVFLMGARIAVDTARKHGCRYALLTDGSPSCGSTFIYGGNHDGKTRSGSGVVATALTEAGIAVFAQHQIRHLNTLIGEKTGEENNALD